MRQDGKQYTTCRVLAPTFGGNEETIHVICYQQNEGEKLRKMHAGDPIALRGHLTIKRIEGRPSSIGLNVRKIETIHSEGN